MPSKEENMTKTKSLCSTVISLLLALAMIVAFIPVISLRAEAADPPLSPLRADNYLYGDGWTWDGQTLRFFGSRSFDTEYTRFDITSTKNGGAAVIDIASSITVDLSSCNSFVASDVPLKITGAGTITVEWSSILFSSSGSIEYSGGAIISGAGASIGPTIFYCGADLTITQGYINIENAAICAKDSINIRNSYAIIGQFNSSNYDPGNFTLEINIDKSYVDASSLYISTSANITTPKYMLADSVLCSKADSSEFTKDGNPYFGSIKDSVVYLPEMKNIDWLGTDALSGLDAKKPVSTGGYVFCNEVLTDANRINNYYLKGSSTSDGKFSGVFFDPDQKLTRDLCLTGMKITGGNLFNCLGALSVQNLTAENATIAVISNTSDKNIALYNTNSSGYSFSSCTIAGVNAGTVNSDLIIDGYNSNKCNVYSNTTNSLQAYYTKAATSANNYYAPNGTAGFHSNCDSINANITANCIASKDIPFVAHGNVYAGSLDTSNGSMIFDGSGAYEVNIKSSDSGVEFDNSLIYVHEKNGSDWSYTEIKPDENGSIKYTGSNEIYAGGMVLNPIAGNPVFSGDPMEVSKGNPGTIKVPLTYPFSKDTLDLDIILHDEDGQYDLNWSDIGVTLKILNTGGEKELTLSLEANSSAKAGSYFFYFNINKQRIKAGNTSEIFFKVTINYAKVSFPHYFTNFNYDSSKRYYTISAEYNGTPLVKQGTGLDFYYLVPVDEYFDITLIPEAGYELNIFYGSLQNYIPNSPNGTYHLYADGDITMEMYLTEIAGYTGYYTLDLSPELQKSLADGEINSVTVKYSDGTEKTFDSTSGDHSVKVLHDEKVTVSIDAAEGYSVAKINGADAAYDSKKDTYSTNITMTGHTTVSAEVYKSDELCTLELSILNISNPGDNVTVTPTPVNDKRSEYLVGTECEIVMTITDDKFIGTSEFNGVHIDACSLESDGCHYKVKLAEGANEFYIYYADISILRIPKPANGSVSFSGRLDGGRSHETLSDGTQVYNIGSWDDVTLTLTPDSGCRVKSAKLNGTEVAVNNNTCTFTMEQLVDWNFVAEFEKIPEDLCTVTVKSGANGTVTPGTQAYKSGTEVTLTVTPDNRYKVKSVTMDGKAVKLTDGKCTFTVTADCVFEAEFTKKTSGGSTGGRPRPSGSDYDAESLPILNGTERSWTEIASELGKLTVNSSVQIYLYVSTNVPADVIRIIADRKLHVEFIADSVKSWAVDGSRITAVSSADLSALPGNADRSALRGAFAVDVRVTGTSIPADLRLSLRSEFAGQFANVYKLDGNKLVFQGCAKVGKDGSVDISGVNTAGEYVVMACQFSDVCGDADNDGALTALDAAALLKQIVGISLCENPLMCDLNGDGTVNASDASAILKNIVGA